MSKKAETDWILTYYQQIQNGTVNVGRWIRDWYALIVDGLQQKRFFFDQKKASKVIRFCENFCRHHEGPLAPQLIRLELWQKALLSVIFGILDADGCRQFREVFVEIGRKNGKTLLAAAIASFMMYMDGEYGARLYFVAPRAGTQRYYQEAEDGYLCCVVQLLRAAAGLQLSEERWPEPFPDGLRRDQQLGR